MDLAQLIARRLTLAEQHDAARDRWPRGHAEFVRALEEVVRGLQEIAVQMKATRNVVEIARTRMWLGDALFDLAQGRNAPFQPALDAYRDAEDLVQIANDELLQAKFDANYANILLRANPGLPELADVIARYERALPVLRARERASASAIEKELERATSLRAQLQQLATQLEERRREVLGAVAMLAETQGAPALGPLTELLRELGDAHVHAARMDDFASALHLMERIRTAFQRAMENAAPPRPGARGRLAATVTKLWIAINGTSTLSAQVDKVTRDLGGDLAARLVLAHGALTSASEGQLGEVCRQTLLPLTRDAGHLLSRWLVTWVEPVWRAAPAGGCSRC
jgi:hypothetical protein